MVGQSSFIFLWLGWWHSSKILVDKFGFRLVYDAILEAKLASVMQGKRWNWGPACSEALLHIQS